MPEERLSLEARAKINLGLEVLGKRPDGYHEIRTLMQSVALSDRLDLRSVPGGAIRFSCSDPSVPADEGNLVVRAARLLIPRASGRRGVSIRLTKRIPVGAGLGGGSSDAAATLVGLNRLWGLRIPASELECMGAALGSDVPFFVRGGTQFARGRGEVLARLRPLPRMPVVIVFPNLCLPTASVYGHAKMRLTPNGPLSRLHDCDLTTRSGVMSCVRQLGNDLEPAAAARQPRVHQLLRHFGGREEVVVRVSGSGSSLFVLGGGCSRLRRIVGEIPVRDCRVFETWFAARGWISVVPRGAV